MTLGSPAKVCGMKSKASLPNVSASKRFTKTFGIPPAISRKFNQSRSFLVSSVDPGKWFTRWNSFISCQTPTERSFRVGRLIGHVPQARPRPLHQPVLQAPSEAFKVVAPALPFVAVMPLLSSISRTTGAWP